MRITSTIICDYMSEQFQTRRCGTRLKDIGLSLPEFYEQGSVPEDGKVYIARLEDLPEPRWVQCLFICIGASPYDDRLSASWEMLHILDYRADLLRVFNAVQKIFSQLLGWEEHLRSALNNGGDIETMIRASIPIFQNNLLVTDTEFNFLAHTALQEDGQIRLVRDEPRVPHMKAAGFASYFQQSRQNHEPFVYPADEASNYCINLFSEQEYRGTCVLADNNRPFRERDFSLFSILAEYVQDAVSFRAATAGRGAGTLNGIFSQLLQDMPVSRDSVNNALLLSGCRDAQFWVCLVIRSKSDAMLPVSYIGTNIGMQIPHAVTFRHNERLVTFCPVEYDSGEYAGARINESISPFLKDMNFEAGMSMPVSDLFRSKSAFFQAVSALDAGHAAEDPGPVYAFGHYLPDYMLQHSRGIFETEELLTPGLKWLRENSGKGVDYWGTLRLYLDNECNASQTAKELYMHRSSIFPRLDRIREHVNLDTPGQRLYLRMCMHLVEMNEGA